MMLTLAIYYGVSVLVVWFLLSIVVALGTPNESNEEGLQDALITFALSMIWPISIPFISMAILIETIRDKRAKYLKKREASKIDVR